MRPSCDIIGVIKITQTLTSHNKSFLVTSVGQIALIFRSNHPINQRSTSDLI